MNARLADAALDNQIAAYKRSHRKAEALIARMSMPAELRRYASRSEYPDKCTGPGCPVCAAGGRTGTADVPRRTAAARREISRSADAYRLPAEQCSFIHSRGPGEPHAGPCQLRMAYLWQPAEAEAAPAG